MIIRGGSGLDGRSSSTGKAQNGGSGGEAVVVDSEVLINCSNVCLAGGLAGNGGDGVYRGIGGAGAAPVNSFWYDQDVEITIAEWAENVVLYHSNNGEIGEGKVWPGITDPDFPLNPPEIENPDIGLGDLVLPPIGGGDVLPPPEILFPQD